MLRRALSLSLSLSRAVPAVPCAPHGRWCHRPLSPAPLCPPSAEPTPPQDLAVPNASWSDTMRRHFGHLEATKGWTRLPSFRRARHHFPDAAGPAGDTRLFPRAIEGPGDGFEYVMFVRVPERRLRCLCQPGPFLEGHPGLTHGGAIATLIDSSLGTLALAVAGRVVTANLSIDYVAPVPLGTVVLVDAHLERQEGRKVFLECHLRSAEGDTLHAKATGLFIRLDPPQGPSAGGGQ